MNAETLEELVQRGEVEAALLWDAARGLTPREQELVREAFAKGLEIGKKLAAVSR